MNVLLLVAKAPVAGLAKTRLCPPASPGRRLGSRRRRCWTPSRRCVPPRTPFPCWPTPVGSPTPSTARN
ncbi:hypothetical protein NKG94_01810 [Micromonospora sp. M12]